MTWALVNISEMAWLSPKQIRIGGIVENSHTVIILEDRATVCFDFCVGWKWYVDDIFEQLDDLRLHISDVLVEAGNAENRLLGAVVGNGLAGEQVLEEYPTWLEVSQIPMHILRQRYRHAKDARIAEASA